MGYVVVMGREMATSQDFVNWICGPALDPHFLKYLFIAEHESLHRFSKGTTHSTIYYPEVKAFHVCLPPLAEQKRIVAKLEELTARSRRAKEALDAVPPLLDQLRQSILAAAFRGDLTADWRAKNPDVEPGDEFLARFREERRAVVDERASTARRGQSALAAMSLGPEPDLPPVPAHWAWALLEELTLADRPICYGVVQPGEDASDGIRLVRVCDMSGDGLTVDESDIRTVSPTVDAEYSRSRLQGGELLVSVVGTIGRTAIAPPSLKGANIARAVAMVAFPVAWLAEWTAFWLNTPMMIDRMNRDSREVARKTLNIGQLATMPVPVPPANEANAVLRIVREAHQGMKEVSARLVDSRTNVARLDTSILALAFRGELVPQDKGDQPAANLLKRIGAAPSTSDTPHAKPRSRSATAATVDKQTDDSSSARREVRSGRDSLVRRNHAGVPRPDPATYTPEDWHHILLTTLPPTRTDRETAIRTAAECARDNLGLTFSRLRKDGQIVQALRSAITAAIRSGDVIRHGSTHISRAPGKRPSKPTK